MERNVDSRVRAFGEYLDEQIAFQKSRPYHEREDIERTLGVYETVRIAYQGVLQIGSLVTNNSLYEKPIDDLILSARARACLERLQITTLGQLIEKTEEDLIIVRNMGKISIKNIKSELSKIGLSLKPVKSS